MTLIVFRELPAVAKVERMLELQSRGLLTEDEIEELPHLIDDASRELFGITANETFYPALPEGVRGQYDRRAWEANFDCLGQYTRDPNAHWRAFGLDCCCEQGLALHCLDVFGRQLVCALYGLHPQARMTFADREIARAA